VSDSAELGAKVEAVKLLIDHDDLSFRFIGGRRVVNETYRLTPPPHWKLEFTTPLSEYQDRDDGDSIEGYAPNSRWADPWDMVPIIDYESPPSRLGTLWHRFVAWKHWGIAWQVWQALGYTFIALSWLLSISMWSLRFAIIALALGAVQGRIHEILDKAGV